MPKSLTRVKTVVSTCRLPSNLRAFRIHSLLSLTTTTNSKTAPYLVERFQARAQAANFTTATIHCLVLLQGSHSCDNLAKPTFEPFAHPEDYEYNTRLSFAHLISRRKASQ
jgi:hypothetical protein